LLGTRQQLPKRLSHTHHYIHMQRRQLRLDLVVVVPAVVVVLVVPLVRAALEAILLEHLK
jgi:flagellar biosynthesis protein FliQ